MHWAQGGPVVGAGSAASEHSKHSVFGVGQVVPMIGARMVYV
jgi:hypothetical protein